MEKQSLELVFDKKEIINDDISKTNSIILFSEEN